MVARCQVVQTRQPGQGSGREKLEVERGMSRTVQPPSFPMTFGLRATTWGDLNPQTHPSQQDAHERSSSWRPAAIPSERSAPSRSRSASVSCTSPDGLRISVTSTPVLGS